jgi:CRP/FNR family transcriptional regulator, cyclic AMP receptor protein
MFKRSHPSDRLHAIPLFEECTPAELARIDSSLTAIRLETGQVVVREGHYGAELLIVAEGEVRVTRHSPAGDQELAVLGRGDFVGEIALLEGTPRTASVTAAAPSLVWVANPREFAVLMSIPSVAAAIRGAAAARKEANRLAAAA